MQDQPKFAGCGNPNSYTRFFAFSKKIDRGLKAKMEPRNEGKYLKIREVEIEW
jgi:hypothetical protein